jgi:predicted metalloprotease
MRWDKFRTSRNVEDRRGQRGGGRVAGGLGIGTVLILGIVGYALGDKPPRLEDPDNLPDAGSEHALAALGYSDDEVPF